MTSKLAFIALAPLFTWSAPSYAQSGDSPPILRGGPVDPGASRPASGPAPTLGYADVYADGTGATHVQHCALKGFAFKSYAPPAAPQWVGVPPGNVTSISYAVLPVGYVGAWHHAPGPQWVVVLSGRWSVQTTDGAVLEQGPGETQFNADQGAKPQGPGGHVGHLTRQVGSEPTVQLIVSLKDGAGGAAVAKPCEPIATMGR